MTPSSINDAPPSLNNRILFWASFLTLIAAGIGFSVRGVILGDWGNQFGFTQGELGKITGGGLAGFGLAIIFFSFFADKFGYGKLMLIAFLLHLSSAVVTFSATFVFDQYGKEAAYWCLFAGMWLFALGNGTCEAVINPLTATLYPRNKTHWLNILHAGWPLGLIIGVVITLGFEQIDATRLAHDGRSIPWEYKLGVFLIPVVLYGLMMFNRTFPRSEAKTSGVSLPDMMAQVGMLGIALVVGLIGLLLSGLVPIVAESTGFKIPNWSGWAVAGVLWLGYGLASRFALGSALIAFLYLLHALIGFVELGTDSWITNITKEVLQSGTNAQLAFIWTNILMFTLRFFAGPIVHKINPIGLLFMSAVLGTLGLYLLGQPFTNSVWPWVAAVTVYGIGKTFYWPTLLGVISERFPRGGALALGISGGIGMLSAGLLGGPGIGYGQDLFTVTKLQELSPKTYERYMARDNEGNPAKSSNFPLASSLFPNEFPIVAGIDNSKYKVFEDFKVIIGQVAVSDKQNALADQSPRVLSNKPMPSETFTLTTGSETTPVKVFFTSRSDYKSTQEAAQRDTKQVPPLLQTTVQKDLDLRSKAKTAEPKLDENLNKLNDWWTTDGLTHFSTDQSKLDEAKLYGAKQALLHTAYVPAALAIGFLVLIAYFAMTGGYKQVHLDQEPPMGEY